MSTRFMEIHVQHLTKAFSFLPDSVTRIRGTTYNQCIKKRQALGGGYSEAVPFYFLNIKNSKRFVRKVCKLAA